MITISSKLHVLVVDDDSTGRKITNMMLERLGYMVDTATNGLEAIQLSEHYSYDLILMDIIMPQLNGFEATRAIRNLNVIEKQPLIIAFTAYAHPEIEEMCAKAGMEGYILRPVTTSQLVEAISKYCPH